MKRLSILALSIVCLGGTAYLTTTSANAKESGELYLIGEITGTETDGAFPAKVVIKDPISEKTLFHGETLVDIKNSRYKAKLKQTNLESNRDYSIDINGLEAAEDFSMAGFVNLQDASPGTAQTGHLNISGNILAGRIGLGTSPTLARVQVSETGTAQGVRSITNSGVAVYGQATAASGLASGGYFTTSSVGGRAMVGDALSTTGSTVGGLFYNRSVDGVAVWGRHINSSGNSIGVFGQTASATGTAIIAENTGTSSRVELAGANGTILTSGQIPRHQYTASSAANMVPIAYGYVGGSAGAILSGSGNFTVNKSATGKYEIEVAGLGLMSDERYVVTGSAFDSAGSELLAASNPANSGYDFRINTYSIVAAAAVDTDFMFIVYRDVAFSPPAMPERWRNAETTEWQRADPAGYKAYTNEFSRRRKEAMRVVSPTLPTDEAEPTPQIIRPIK